MFLEDFPTCHRLLLTDAPETRAAKAEYETLLKIHTLTAALVAHRKDNKVLPRANEDGISWRQQIVSFLASQSGVDSVPDLFSAGENKSTTPFVVVVGDDTAFPVDGETNFRFYDGTANTLLLLASYKAVPADSTQDILFTDLSDWMSGVEEGFFASTVSGRVMWFPKEYPLEELLKLANANDRKRVYFPRDLHLGEILVDRRKYCGGIECDDDSWVRMKVEVPRGQTPDEVFKEIQKAALNRNWPRFYGCLTLDARYEQFSTLLIDVGFMASQGRLERNKIQTGSQDAPKKGKIPQRARDCLAVFEKYKLPAKTKYASALTEPDSFVVDAWDAMASPGASLFEKGAHLTEVKVDGDFAIARAHNFRNRHGSEKESCFVHFVKVDGQWRIDISPWWMPWGRPLIERRKILFERYARQ